MIVRTGSTTLFREFFVVLFFCATRFSWVLFSSQK